MNDKTNPMTNDQRRYYSSHVAIVRKARAAALAAIAAGTVGLTGCSSTDDKAPEAQAAPAAATTAASAKPADWKVDLSAPVWVARFRCQSYEKLDADLFRCYAPTYAVTLQRTSSPAEAAAVVKDAPSQGIVAWSPGDKFVVGAKSQADLDAVREALKANN